jgi:flagellar protein FlaG
MDFNLPPISGIEPPAPPQRAAGNAKGADFSAQLASAASATVDTLPTSPPEDVLQQMHDAAMVADKLRSMQRELHFEPQPNGRVVVQVRDLDGHVIRTIPAGRALDIASGSPLD